MGELLKSFDKIIVPEMNTGQLKTVLRDQFLVDAQAAQQGQRPALPHRRDRGGDREEALAMKPINPFPMIIMLILVCCLIYWVLYR